MIRAAVLLLALLFISPHVSSATPTDPLAEQKRLQKLQAAIAGPTDPNAELKKVQKINNDQAILFFTTQIKKTPKDASLYAKRGKAYQENGDYARALPDYDKALKLNPKLPEPYTGRAVIYLMKKDYDKCWENVHQAEALGGQFWPAFMEGLKKGSGREK